MSSSKPAFSLLGKSVTSEHDFSPQVFGQLPTDLSGMLYRNGPGLFERNGHTKSTLLDGDGYMQAYQFAGGQVKYQSKFVRTKRFVEEEASGRFLYKTWATRSPESFRSNMKFGVLSQAGVAPVFHNGKLLAFDDVASPYELDPLTLATLGEHKLDSEQNHFNAHCKIDARNGDLITFGHEQGPKTVLHFSVFCRNGKLKAHQKIQLSRTVYLHDFFATENHVIFNVHAIEIGVLPMVLGFKSFVECMKWNPKHGNILIVADRNGIEPPKFIECPARWMWHSLNAFEKNGTIVADFVGYDEPDHFIGKDPLFSAVMQGRAGISKSRGSILRYEIDPRLKTVKELVVQKGNFEFPVINGNVSCHAHRYGYFATGTTSEFLQNAVSSYDYQTGRLKTFAFEEGCYAGEPVFAPRTGGTAEDSGYLLTQVLDSKNQESFLAVLRADAVEDGPVAKVKLGFHLPISFHGAWVGT